MVINILQWNIKGIFNNYHELKFLNRTLSWHFMPSGDTLTS